MVPYSFERGETISLALDAVQGDPALVTGVTAKLKAVAPGRAEIAPGTPVSASFTVNARPAAGELPAGWTLTIAAAASAALTPGLYKADALIEIAGGVVITDKVAISIVEPVTAT